MGEGGPTWVARVRWSIAQGQECVVVYFQCGFSRVQQWRGRGENHDQAATCLPPLMRRTARTRRYNPVLARRIAEMGGLSGIFLTHRRVGCACVGGWVGR